MHQKEHIWVVDDEPAVADLIERAFQAEKLSCQLVSFTSHRDLVNQLDKGGVLSALLVVDYYLGTENGLEVVERLQASVRTSDVKVVLFSQALTPDVVLKANELGVYQVLTKPSSFGQWRELARDLCLAGYFV